MNSSCSTEIPKTVITAATKDVDLFHYLGVGSGSGRSDIKLLIQLRKEYPKIKATIIEPIGDMITEFKKKIIKVGSDLEDVEFVWKNMAMEEYMTSDTKNQDFHCILLVGVTSYFEDLEGTMKHLYNVLTTTGTIAIVNSSEKSVFPRMVQHYPDLLPSYNIAPTEKLVVVFHDIGANVRVSEVEAVIDITSCLQEKSEVGNLLLDLFTHVVNFRATASKDLSEDVLQFLQSPNLLSRKTDNNVFVNNSRDVVIVQSD
ncbi:histamine N-methyltransferase A-like [Glandiceps talaboti]